MEPLTRGDDKVYTITVLGADGLAADLTGCTVRWTAKRKRSDSQSAAVIAKSTAVGEGIALASPQSGATKGKAYLTFVPADTASLTILASTLVLCYDVQVTTGAGLVNTTMQGDFTVTADVTTPSS